MCVVAAVIHARFSVLYHHTRKKYTRWFGHEDARTRLFCFVHMRQCEHERRRRAHHGGFGKAGCCWSAGPVVSCERMGRDRRARDSREVCLLTACFLLLSAALASDDRSTCTRSHHRPPHLHALRGSELATRQPPAVGREHELEPPCRLASIDCTRASPLRTVKRTNGDCCTRRRPRRPNRHSARARRSPPSPIGSAVPKPESRPHSHQCLCFRKQRP